MIKLQKILFPTDFSELSLHAMDYVRSFAEAYRAEIHVLHVVDEAYQYWMAMGPNMAPIGPPPQEMVEVGAKELEKFVAKHLAGCKCEVKRAVTLARPFVGIIQYARDNEIDLIIIGTHGRSGIKHALLGSVAERVVRKAPCPVLTIRHPEHDFIMP